MKYIGEREPHYGLRKLSIGVASVLLGISIYGVVGHADNEVPVSGSKNNVSVSKNVGDDNLNANDQVVLQSKTGGDNPAGAQNVEGEGTRNQENVAVNGRQSVKENTLNTSGVQNGNSNRAAVNDSKVQVNSDNTAKNVSGDWYWNRNIVSNQGTIQSIIGNDTYRMGLSLSFDVDGSQLKAGNIIDIAKLTQISDSQGESSFVPESTSVPVSIQGQNVGYLELTPQGTSAPAESIGVRFSELDYRLHVTAANLDFQGTQHVNFHTDWIGTLNYSGAWSFRGTNGGLVTYHLIGDKLDKEYKVQYSWPSAKIEKKYTLGYSLGADAGSFLTDGGWTNPGIWVYSPILDGADSEQLKLFQESDGTKGNFSLDHNVQVAARIRADKGNSILYSVSDASTNLFYPLTDVNGSLITQNMGGDNDSIIFGHSYTVSIPQKAFANDLTLDQLKAFNYQGLAVSSQSDGTLLWYFNLPVKMFQFDFSKLDDRTIQQIANSELYFNRFAKSDQDAIDMVKQMANYWANGPLKGTPQRLRFNGSGVMVSDPSSHPNVYLDLLDVNTGKVVQTSEEVGQYTDTSVKGQSTVKLHVVSSTNGTDLATVKSFTDWPNQGKHAQLDVPTIAGYQLAENPQSVLTKFHLNGKVITVNSAVDYPAENTIADYYIVMAPKDENMTVNIVDDDENGKVLDSGTINGKFGDKVVESSDIQGKIKKLLDSGLYTLESNDLDNGLTFKDGSQTVTVKLKHKLDSVQRHYRVIEDLPDGSQKMIIDVEATLYKDANAKYYNGFGALLNGQGTVNSVVHLSSGVILKKNDIKVIKGSRFSSADDSIYSLFDILPGYSYKMINGTNGNYQQGIDAGFGPGIWFELDNNNMYAFVDLFHNIESLTSSSNNAVENPLSSRDFHIVYTPKDEVATVNIVDADENNKVLSTGTVTGKFNTQIITNDDVQAKLKSLLDTGHYVLQSNGFDQAAKYQDGTNTITIALKHKIDSTQRHYRVIEDLPNGSQKVIIDMEATLYKDSDSDNWYFDGAHLDGQQNGNILQANVYDDKLGTVLDDASYLSAPVDLIPGYSIDWHKLSGPDRNRMIDTTNYSVSAYLRSHPTRAHLDMFNGHIPVTNILDSCDGHIYYMKNQYPVTLSYYDLTGKLISSTKKNYDYQTVVDLTATAPANYVLLSGQPGQLTVGTDTNEVDLLVAPKIERSQENKVVTRTINLHGGNVKIGPVIQKVVFVREKVLNLATGDTSYGNWQVQGDDQFSMYVPPIIDGYHINKVDAKIVSADDSDSMVYLNYEQDESEQWPMYIDVNGKSYDKLPDGYHVVKGQDSKKGSLLIVKDESVVAPVRVEYVMRTITVIMPNGRTRTIKQKARKGSKFLTAHLPKLRGYKLVISGNIDSVAASGDMTASVEFVKM